MLTMRFIPTIAIFISFFLPPVTNEYHYAEKYLEVPVDHFSFANYHTFKLRYLVNDSYWNNDGPIFFYTGNEGDIEAFAQNTGFMWEIAPSYRALIVFAEHRYYGKSLPFGNDSFLDPNHIGYLHSSQALADYVILIEFLQELYTYSTELYKNPVIAFGGSYGGMLSAWLRLKYPATVLGAVASSAPIWQFETPCDVYNKILTSVYKVSSANDCSKIIKSTWPAIREITSTHEGRQWLTDTWKLCEPLQESDIEYLLNWLQDVYSNMAMVNYPYPTNFLANLPGNPVKKFCNLLSDSTFEVKEILQNLGYALSIYTNYTKTTTCVTIKESFDNFIGYKAWDFQACTEMIMPMCSTRDEMFEVETWNFTKYATECFNKWKIRVTNSNFVISEYGGKNLQGASNIIFTNGLLDPWAGGGVLHSLANSVLALAMPDAAHHLDLRASHPNDPVSVINVRMYVQKILRQWLRHYYQEYLNVYYN
ncbi:hypothetical protein FQA39_LY00339 [Lamprigera yunnana]|nr:hypothetical protein FQA39_LY00339 [Lamprigera yunnana]